MSEYKTEDRDGMRVDWDVPIRMDDGIVLRADVFRPIEPGRYPALVSYGPYGKGLAFQGRTRDGQSRPRRSGGPTRCCT